MIPIKEQLAEVIGEEVAVEREPKYPVNFCLCRNSTQEKVVITHCAHTLASCSPWPSFSLGDYCSNEHYRQHSLLKIVNE